MKNFLFYLSASLLTVFSVLNMGYVCSPLEAKSFESKVKSKIDDIADSLKEDVDKLGNNVQKIQEYLDHYSYKGMIQDQVSYGPVTLSHMVLNNRGKAVVVKPGERIQGTVECDLHKEKCSSLHFYRVVLGFANEGAQTTVCNSLGTAGSKTLEKFNLIAPTVPGIYEIRFRPVESFIESTALKEWYNKEGNQPSAETTVGVVVVNK